MRWFIGLITLYSITPTYYSVIIILPRVYAIERGKPRPRPPGAPTFVQQIPPHLQRLPGKRSNEGGRGEIYDLQPPELCQLMHHSTSETLTMNVRLAGENPWTLYSTSRPYIRG